MYFVSANNHPLSQGFALLDLDGPIAKVEHLDKYFVTIPAVEWIDYPNAIGKHKAFLPRGTATSKNEKHAIFWNPYRDIDGEKLYFLTLDRECLSAEKIETSRLTIIGGKGERFIETFYGNVHICWGGRDRTFAWWDQNPLPYRLATPHCLLRKNFP